MKTFIKITLLLGLLGAASCAHQKVEYHQGNSVSTEKDEKGLIMTIQWIKWKGEKFDVHYWLQNRYEHNVIIKENAFGFNYEGVEGSLNRTNRMVELKPGASDMFYLTFRYPQKVSPRGTATLTIDPINEGNMDKVGKKLNPLKIQLPVNN